MEFISETIHRTLRQHTKVKKLIPIIYTKVSNLLSLFIELLWRCFFVVFLSMIWELSGWFFFFNIYMFISASVIWFLLWVKVPHLNSQLCCVGFTSCLTELYVLVGLHVSDMSIDRIHSLDRCMSSRHQTSKSIAGSQHTYSQVVWFWQVHKLFLVPIFICRRFVVSGLFCCGFFSPDQLLSSLLLDSHSVIFLLLILCNML